MAIIRTDWGIHVYPAATFRVVFTRLDGDPLFTLALTLYLGRLGR